MTHQLEHSESKFLNHTFPFCIVLDRVQKSENIALVGRLADAFGVSEIFLLDNEKSISQALIKKSRHTLSRTVTLTQQPRDSYIQSMQEDDKIYRIALEVTDDSRPISEMEIPKWSTAIHLVFGNEKNGIAPDILAACRAVYHINMYGQNSSMNIATSCAIALYVASESYQKN